MSAVEAIVAALFAGAGMRRQGPASAAVVAAHVELKELIKDRVGVAHAEVVQELDADGVEPVMLRDRLGEVLIESGVGDDEQVLVAVRRLFALIDLVPDPSSGPSAESPDRRSTASPASDVASVRGGQFGDHNSQYNYFGGVAPVGDVSGSGSVGVGGSVYAPLTTNVVHAHVYPGREPVWPVRVGVVPPPVHCRQDRPADHRLATAMAEPGAVLVGQVVSGLGGVGKTQVAATIANQLWSGGAVDLLVWVTATSRVGIIDAYAQAATASTGIDDPNPLDGADRLLAWLAVTDRRWLIVLDDLADPADLTGLWPPVVERGRTVVTTRRRDAALLAGRRVIDVDVFTPAQARNYLQSKLEDHPHRLEQADALASDLGYLPLALAQAAAYILDRGVRMTCAAYRQRLADQRRRLSELAPHALPDQHQATVSATWVLSIDQADRLAPVGMARPVLQLCALLDPNAVPGELSASRAIANYCTDRLGRPIEALDIDDALHLLRRFSLITIDEVAGAIRIHGLLQRAVREAVAPDQMRALAQAAADALLEMWPPVEYDAARAQLLRNNVARLYEHTGSLLLDGEDGVHRVLFKSGDSVGRTGLAISASEYFQKLSIAVDARHGPDHRDVLETRYFATFWADSEVPAEKLATFMTLLADQTRVLGPGEPDTLRTRGDIATWRGMAVNPAEAVAEFEVVEADAVRLLGADHPVIWTIRSNHAYWRGLAGDNEGAVDAFHEILSYTLRLYGPDHPRTLSRRYYIAFFRRAGGDPATAIAELWDLVRDTTRALGPHHRETLGYREDLAHWQGEVGDPAGAAAALEELLVDQRRFLGRDHPDTLRTRDKLLHWRGELRNSPRG
ncbi:hypothetical protein GCM10009557_07800 [Virgisporangium ochraceum]|uniref:NB-ARC domain protein n=1 Tax=Virgisporangium ochraceum TaxID=65505 RepID=A0A8J3ZYW5_9ACTN|nr:NB-ARC domain-containing protein [Virgisporangium ochraceum]GIJ72704.1 hypothetical protein Voc01_076210 [Virgisporangium ochraceum]